MSHSNLHFHSRIINYFLPVLLILYLSGNLFGQLEKVYISEISAYLNGKSEVGVIGGRVDIVTDNFAIEVEKAATWKHSIGQSLWYALQTNKKPGIVLIVKNSSEYKYLQRLQSAVDYANLNIKIWAYPEDFQTQINEKKSTLKKKKSLTNEVVIAPSKPIQIQFFKSRYSNKSFPQLSSMGAISSFSDGALTTYIIEVENIEKLSDVRQVGFKDAFVLNQSRATKNSNSSKATINIPSKSKSVSQTKSKVTRSSFYTPSRSTSRCHTVRCSGQTLKRARCKRKTKNCSGRCWQH